jgi:hypothetical protein
MKRRWSYGYGNIEVKSNRFVKVLCFLSSLFYVICANDVLAFKDERCIDSKLISRLQRPFDILRGGATSYPESVVEEFLSQNRHGYDDQFHIHGWRWHTLSFVRDSNRLHRLTNEVVKKVAHHHGNHDDFTKQIEILQVAVNHVVNFNLKGLQDIEENLFFPWLRDKLGSSKEVGKELHRIIDSIDLDRKQVTVLAEKMNMNMRNLERTRSMETLYEILHSSSSMSSIMKSIQNKENRFIVPSISRIVPVKEQKAFNSKVLKKLGLLQSRIHLVGMYDTVHDNMYGNDVEKKLFNEFIPKIPRMMIPRWRQSLYLPQVGELDSIK